VGCLYKIIAKILSNRLDLVLPSIIYRNQFAFIEGKGLLDSVIVANEVIEEARNNRKQCLIVKLDFEKPYDLVCWDFLYFMLGILGFGTKWVSWIKACLESCTIFVLVNDSPTQEFTPTKGLRQGDLLAPLLFLLKVVGLS